MKKSLLALLALCAISSTGFAQITNTSGDNFWLYTVDGNNEAKLVGIAPYGVTEFQRYEYRVGFEVPADVDGYPLTTIGSGAFETLRANYYDTIVIYAATRVEDRAFEKVQVKKIEFWGETLSIGDNAFQDCTLENIGLFAPNAVTRIGHYAFYFANRFRGFTTLDGGYLGPIPPSVMSIGFNAFFELFNLPIEVAIPSGISHIDQWFVNTSVQRLIIPDTVTHVQQNAFNHQVRPTPNVLLFKGSPPVEPFTFSGTIYRLPGASGWSNTFGAVPVQIFLEKATATGMSPTSGFQFSWSGSGPFPVNIERATSPGGPWTVISTGKTDGQFTDPTPPSRRAFYRAQATIP